MKRIRKISDRMKNYFHLLLNFYAGYFEHLYHA